jgi:hypothetical protein
MIVEESVEGVNQSADVAPRAGHAPWHAHEAKRRFATPHRFCQQRPEVSEVAGYDRAALLGARSEMHVVRQANEARLLADSDYIVPTVTELACNLGREVLVE